MIGLQVLSSWTSHDSICPGGHSKLLTLSIPQLFIKITNHKISFCPRITYSSLQIAEIAKKCAKTPQLNLIHHNRNANSDRRTLKLFKLDWLHFYQEKFLFSSNTAKKTFIFIFLKLHIDAGFAGRLNSKDKWLISCVQHVSRKLCVRADHDFSRFNGLLTLQLFMRISIKDFAWFGACVDVRKCLRTRRCATYVQWRT